MKDWLTLEMMYFITAGVIILATLLLSYIFNRFMKRYIKKSSAELDNDPTNYQFLRHTITALIYLVGISLAVYSIPGLKTLAQSMLAGAGIAAVAIGFASQAALSNVIAGVFIVIFKPFRVNDRIEIGTTMSGVVEDITLRHTVIRNYNNKRIVIPNSIISNEAILNADIIDQKVVLWIEIGISYDSDIDKAKQIIANESEKHPLMIDNRTEEEKKEGYPIVEVRVISLGDFSVNLKAWVWAKDQPDAFVMKCELLESVKKRFDKEGIEIPFPYRTIVMKTPPTQ